MILLSLSAISWNTLTELIRQKVFFILLVFGLIAVGSSGFVAQLSFQEEFQMLKDVCLGAMSVFTSLLAILATAAFLPKDLEDRTIYTLLAKPVPRFVYLLGKLCGLALLLLIFTIVMTGLFLLVLWIREATVVAATKAQFADSLDSEVARAALNEISQATFTPGLLPGIAIIYVKSVLLAAMTLLISTFATSLLFTVMASAAVYFIGHLQATAREYWLGGYAVAEWWQTLLVGFVSLVFPDLQAFSLTDDVIAGASIPMGVFFETFGLGLLYVGVYFLLASFVFSTREL